MKAEAVTPIQILTTYEVNGNPYMKVKFNDTGYVLTLGSRQLTMLVAVWFFGGSIREDLLVEKFTKKLSKTAKENAKKGLQEMLRMKLLKRTYNLEHGDLVVLTDIGEQIVEQMPIEVYTPLWLKVVYTIL